MKMQILGSAAAEGWPALFCECQACTEARRLGGPNIRRRASYALDDDILIEYGPDVYWQTVQFGIDLSRIEHIIVTHSHGDHLNPAELGWRRKGYSVVTKPLTLHGNQHVLERIRNEQKTPPENMLLTLKKVGPGQTFQAGDLTVLALRAQHASDEEDALNYVFQRDGVSILLASDTGWWGQDTWDALRGMAIDAAIIECTYGVVNAAIRSYHLGVEATVAVRDELKRIGALRENALVVANHFSHNGGALHEELRDFFVPKGIEVGYDGMIIEPAAST